MKNCLFRFYIFLTIALLASSCDINLLGGKKSQLSDNFEPGKRVESQYPPVITPIGNFVMDENDVQSVAFQI